METAGRKANITIRLTEFEMPPMQDFMVIGREAPIGPEAVRRMVDALSPEQYEVILLAEGNVEAMVVRKRLFDLLPKEQLVSVVLEEVAERMPATFVVKGQITVDIIVNRQVTL